MPFETFFSGRLKVKVIGVKLRSKRSSNKLVWAITGTFMHGFQNNFAQLLSSRRNSAVRNICSRRLMVKVTLEDQMIEWS